LNVEGGMANTIVGRVKELRELQDIIHSDRAEFVAIYGRRRIGKTYLINNFFAGSKCTYFQTVGFQDGSRAVQLENFTDDLSKCFYNNEPMEPAKNWKEAFKRLTKAIEIPAKNRRNKIVLFFDELPWMATHRSGFLNALEYYWNRYWCNMPNMKLVICGSSASWIIKKIINNKGGLHNRVTKEIALRPFVLYETKEYLERLGCNFTVNQILEIYMAVGGVPYYLNYIKKNLSAMQNINNLCFRKDGALFGEFEKLFKSLFKEADAYIEIIRIISKTRHGIPRSELEHACKLSGKGGSFSEKLKDLEDAGFVLSFLPFKHNKHGIFYKVIDEYSLFYFKWIEPEEKSLLKLEINSNFWENKYKTPAWNNWSGYAFESICYKHLDVIRRVLNIPAGSRASPWQYVAKDSGEDGAQIDLVFDREDKAFTICEIKFTEEPYVISKAYVKNLINKEKAFVSKTKTKKQIFLTIISANGLKDNIHSGGLVSGVVMAEDFFNSKYIEG